jgi:hypothetical protein
MRGCRKHPEPRSRRHGFPQVWQGFSARQAEMLRASIAPNLNEADPLNEYLHSRTSRTGLTKIRVKGRGAVYVDRNEE